MHEQSVNYSVIIYCKCCQPIDYLNTLKSIPFELLFQSEAKEVKRAEEL